MKRLIALLFVLLLFPVISCSEESPRIISHYSMTADLRSFASGKDSFSFQSDALLYDIYFTDDPCIAYVWVCECIGGTYLASGFSTVTVIDRDDCLYLVDSKGNYTTARYDENGTDLWMDLEYGTFRLRPVPSFSMFDDWR